MIPFRFCMSGYNQIINPDLVRRIMTEYMVKIPITFPSGEIVAIGVPEEDFFRDFMDSYHEWVNGVVIRMSPIAIEHNNLLKFLIKLFDAYFGINPIGQTLVQPFVMRLENSFREPDIQVVLADNPATLTRTQLLGAADICIEIVSEESVARDYGDKLKEYQRAGV
jgi:Uma2 family endonuclease